MEWKIGELAKKVGVNIQTIRYYERSHLLEAESRSASGYRYFGEESLKKLNFILKAKGLGFSLKEIRDLLTLRADPKKSCHEVKTQAKQKQTELQKKITFLKQLDSSLSLLIKECDLKEGDEPCPILSNLELNF